jgi:fatty acid desaturase
MPRRYHRAERLSNFQKACPLHAGALFWTEREDSMADFLTYEELMKRGASPKWWEPKLDRAVFQNIMKRNDYRAFLSHGLYFLILAAAGYVSAYLYSRGSLWCILAFFVYGALFGMCNSRVHESLHGTPFKTVFWNEIVYFLTSAMEFRCPLSTRWSHMIHHSYTIITGTDLEILAPRPARFWKIFLDFFYLNSLFFSLIPTLVQHSLGIPTESARRVAPESEFRKFFWSSRLILGVHLAVVALAIVLHSWLPVLLFSLPRLYGGWLIWALIFAQHAGLAENVLDHRINTRSIHLNPILSFLYMHMENHTEHHIYPNIPFHALARFRREIDDQMPPACTSLWNAYREIVPAILKQRHDTNWFIKREIPKSTKSRGRS